MPLLELTTQAVEIPLALHPFTPPVSANPYLSDSNQDARITRITLSCQG